MAPPMERKRIKKVKRSSLRRKRNFLLLCTKKSCVIDSDSSFSPLLSKNTLEKNKQGYDDNGPFFTFNDFTPSPK